MSENILTFRGWEFGRRYITSSHRTTKSFPNQIKTLDNKSASSFFTRVYKWVATEAVEEFLRRPTNCNLVSISVDCTINANFKMSPLDLYVLEDFLWNRVSHD